MKRLITFAVLAAAAAPLSAYADTELTDVQYIAATRCIAYANHSALSADAPDVSALRAAVRSHSTDPIAWSRADDVRREVRRRRARSDEAIERLRSERDATCAPFVEMGLVQVNGSSGA